MDKYEHNLKLDQIRALLSDKKYEMAAEIADTINWNKVRNVNSLVKAGEVYEKVGRYEESREILLNAYDRSPIGRTIIYRLAELALKMEDFEGAKEYYDEFVDIAPHDNQRYILQYHMEKAQGAEYKDLIPILEEFKEQEYTEEWAYELADLYHKAGMVDQCIDACDELVLWFGDGPYVEMALELKMLYQPLTKVQEEKYKQFRHEKEGKTVMDSIEMEQAGEFIQEPVIIPTVNLASTKFNTTNLQEEIAKGMQQIMEATEKETVVGTMDSIKKLAEEIPYLNLPKEESAAKEIPYHTVTDEKIDEASTINFKELLEEGPDGQMNLVMKEKAMLERQITGQITIEDILSEWENTRETAETAHQDTEFRKPEPVKPHALQEAENIMDRLMDVIPKFEEGIKKTNQPENKKTFTAREGIPAYGEHIPVMEMPIFEEQVPIESNIEFGEGLISEIPEVLPKIALVEPEELDDLLSEESIKETQRLSLTDEQKAIFSYFVPVKGMETQLCRALAGISASIQETSGSKMKHLIIQGCQGCGKTVLATSIIKVLQKECGYPNGRVGKIDAEVLNKKDIRILLKKVAGGCLIIEKAGEIDRTTAVTLALLLEQDSTGTLVILEDTSVGIKKALSMDDGLAKKFTEKVIVPIFNNDDFISFARSYSNELGYEIDEMAILALHNRISNIEKIDQETTLVEVKAIIDEAIEREAHGGIRKAFNILTAKRYTDDDKILLTEKDFE